MYLLAIRMFSLEKCLFRSLLPIFQLGCFFVVELYELFAYLENRPLSVALLAKIFSHLVYCLFIFLMVSILFKGIFLKSS